MQIYRCIVGGLLFICILIGYNYADYLAGVKKSRDRAGIVYGTAADNVLSVVNTRRIFWKKPLMRRIEPSAENPPLPSVGMPRNDEINL